MKKYRSLLLLVLPLILLLAACGGAITAKNAADMAESQVIEVEDMAPVSAVAFVPGSSTEVFTQTRDNMVRLWNLETGSATFELRAHGESGSTIAFSTDGKLAATGGDDYRVKVWDAESWNEMLTITASGHPNQIAFTPADEIIIAADDLSRAEVFDSESGELLREIDFSERTLTSVAFSGDDKLMVLGSTNGTITVFDSGTEEQVFQSSPTYKKVMDVGFSSDDAMLAAVYSDGQIILWDTKNWSMAGAWIDDDNINGSVAAIFSKDGSLLFTTTSDGAVSTLQIWDVEERTLVNSVNLGAIVYGMDLSEDGELLAIALQDGRILILSAG